jgi:hypothetical protein
VLWLYRWFRRGVASLVSIAFVALFGEWCIKIAEQHHLFDDAAAPLIATSNAFSYVQSWPGFWIAIAGLTGLAVGMYLDIFVRRYAIRQPTVTEWLSPLKSIEAFVDGEIRNARSNARDRCKPLQDHADQLRRKFSALNRPPLVASENRAKELGQLSGELEEAERVAREAENTAILKDEEIRQSLIGQLKSERLIARGFEFKALKVADDQTIIPASHWRLLKFDTYDPKLETVTGGGKSYKAIEIGANRRWH